MKIRFIEWPFLVFLIYLPLTGMVGCSSDSRPKPIPAKGLLTLDGKPFGPANLLMFPMGDLKSNPAGTVESDGQIQFTTYAVNDGIPVGDYRVFVTPSAVGDSPVPAVYSDEKKSPLIVKVLEGSTELKLDLKSSAGPPRKSSIKGPLNNEAMDVLKTMQPSDK